VPDRIALRGLTAYAHHGVYAFERRQGQTFRMDAVLEVDTRPAAETDDLEKTVNYAELAKQLYGTLSGEPVDLLETLAQRLADVCLAYELVEAVEITVHKPEADLGVPFGDVVVTIRRERRRTHPSPRLASSPRAPGAGQETNDEEGPVV
jgi:dihydroneopterin aldolase